MGFAQTNQPGHGRVAQHLGILCGYAILQKGAARFGCGACRIKQVFPTDRHPVQQSQTMARPGPLAGGFCFGQGAVSGHAGIDAAAEFMGLGRVQKGLGQIDRIKMPRADFPSEFRDTVAVPLHCCSPDCQTDGNGTEAHGQSREFVHMKGYEFRQ